MLTAAGVDLAHLAQLGARSSFYDARSVATRISTTTPGATAEVVPGAGHDLPLHHPDEVAARMVRVTAAHSQQTFRHTAGE